MRVPDNARKRDRCPILGHEVLNEGRAERIMNA